MLGDGAKHLREQIHNRLHVAERRMSTALRQPVILPQCLQFAVAGGHGIEQTLGQPQSAETLAADWRNTQPLPLRFQHFIQIIFQIERNQRQAAHVFGKLPINLMRRLAITLQNLAGVTVDARRLGGNLLILIQQLAERLVFRRPAAHPLRRQLDHENRRREAGGFCVNENPLLFVHRSEARLIPNPSSISSRKLDWVNGFSRKVTFMPKFMHSCTCIDVDLK